MGDAEREVLVFAAAHRLIATEQVDVLLAGDSGRDAVVGSLVAAGLLRRVRLFAGGRDFIAITASGLAVIESPLGVPIVDLGDLRREVAAGWVWVRSRDGRFDAETVVLSQRELVGHDVAVANGSGRGRGYGIRVPGFRAANPAGLDHPDVLLVFFDGWAAVHVQLGSLASPRLGALLTAYGTDERYGRLVFLVEQEHVAQQIEAAAASAGVATMTSVQWLEWPWPPGSVRTRRNGRDPG